MQIDACTSLVSSRHSCLRQVLLFLRQGINFPKQPPFPFRGHWELGDSQGTMHSSWFVTCLPVSFLSFIFCIQYFHLTWVFRFPGCLSCNISDPPLFCVIHDLCMIIKCSGMWGEQEKFIFMKTSVV